jgi:hypothetical protein
VLRSFVAETNPAVRTRRVARKVLTSYEFINYLVLTATALAFSQRWATPAQGRYWSFLLVSLIVAYAFDASPVRSLVFKVFGGAFLTMSVALACTFFGLHQVELTDVQLWGGQVSARNRVLSFEIFDIILFARLSVMARIHPHRFVSIPGVEILSMSSTAATRLLNRQTRSTRCKVAPSCVQQQQLQQQQQDVLMLHASASDDSTVAMLVPVHRATVVDERRTLGAALGACALGPGALSAVALHCAVWPLSFGLTVGSLSGAVPASVALALVSFAVISSALRLLHGNVVLLRRILRQFDYWLATGYALAAAASGSVALADDLELAALWSLSQLLLPLVLLYDALPFAADSLGKVHRLVFFPAYLFFCLACLGMLHSGHFPARGEDILLFGSRISPTQSCLSAHLVLSPLALRYLYRITRSGDELLSVSGLRRRRVPMSEARELREAWFFATSSSRRYSFNSRSLKNVVR